MGNYHKAICFYDGPDLKPLKLVGAVASWLLLGPPGFNWYFILLQIFSDVVWCPGISPSPVSFNIVSVSPRF